MTERTPKSRGIVGAQWVMVLLYKRFSRGGGVWVTISQQTGSQAQKLCLGERLGQHIGNLVQGSDVNELNFLIQNHLLKESESNFEMLGRASGFEILGEINARLIVLIKYSGFLDLIRESQFTQEQSGVDDIFPCVSGRNDLSFSSALSYDFLSGASPTDRTPIHHNSVPCGGFSVLRLCIISVSKTLK